jgi:hypothetical protein
MPEVKPPLEPQTNTTKSDIEIFAKAYFNLELTSHQLRLIKDIVAGRQIRLSRRMGLRTAEKVLRAYITEGLTPGGRVRLPQHPLPPREAKMKGFTQEGKILALIKRPQGAYNYELSRFALKYTSVISALRKDGHNIPSPERMYLKNGKPSNTYRYRIIGD